MSFIEDFDDFFDDFDESELDVEVEHSLSKYHTEEMGVHVYDRRRIVLPDHLFVNKIKYIICPSYTEYSYNEKELDDYFAKVRDIIVNGDKPVELKCEPSKNEGTVPSENKGIGLSSHLEVKKSEEYKKEEINTPIEYFWMSWLMSHVPIFIQKDESTLTLKKEVDNVVIFDELGCYVRKSLLAQPAICIFMDNIKKAVDNSKIPDLKVEELVICTVIHELAHAVMDIGWNIKKDDDIDYDPKDKSVSYTYKELNYDKYKEEAWANGLMLLYIKRKFGEDSDIYNHIKEFTGGQPKGYNEGEEYMKKFEEKKDSWYNWYNEKKQMFETFTK